MTDNPKREYINIFYKFLIKYNIYTKKLNI